MDNPETAIVAEIERRRQEQGIVLAEYAPITMPTSWTLGPAYIEAAEARLRNQEAAQEALQQSERVSALVRAAGPRYTPCRLGNFELDGKPEHRAAKAAAVKALSDYAATVKDRRAAREGIVLYGAVGTGKDHLAFAVARAAVLAGFSVRWLNGQDWFGQVRDGMDSGTSEESIVGRIANADFAVISDPLPPIGNLTTHQSTMLYRAIDDRYNAGKPTIVTLNVKDDNEADTRLGEATWDRLCHGAWKIRCHWPSHRKPAREVNP
jgi:DNA replication protein DnaC